MSAQSKISGIPCCVVPYKRRATLTAWTNDANSLLDVGRGRCRWSRTSLLTAKLSNVLRCTCTRITAWMASSLSQIHPGMSGSSPLGSSASGPSWYARTCEVPKDLQRVVRSTSHTAWSILKRYLKAVCLQNIQLWWRFIGKHESR